MILAFFREFHKKYLRLTYFSMSVREDAKNTDYWYSKYSLNNAK